MPNKVGSGTILTPGTAAIAIPQGYYGGATGDGEVEGDANLIAANIISGKSIFGVAGSAQSRQYDSGSVTSTPSSNQLDFTLDSGSLQVEYYVTVSLSFTPNVIILVYSYYSVVYLSESYFGSNSLSHILLCQGQGSAPLAFRLDGTNAYVTSSGFRMPVFQFSQAYQWFAWV
jgi:hypothetical protein